MSQVQGDPGSKTGRLNHSPSAPTQGSRSQSATALRTCTSMTSTDSKDQIEDRRRQPFFMMDNLYIEIHAKHLSPVASLAYFTISKYANSKTHDCFPGLTTIAEAMGVVRNTAAKALEELHNYGLIEIQQRTWGESNARMTNLYILHEIPPEPIKVAQKMSKPRGCSKNEQGVAQNMS